jgi:DNA-binding protein Fis
VPKARHVRIELPGKERILSLAEVQIFQGDKNVAQSGEARQSSTAFEGPAKLALDGNTNGDFNGARSTTHTETSNSPWWEVDLKQPVAIDRVTLWNRTDGSQERLSGFRVVLLDENRMPVWDQVVAEPPKPSKELRPDASRPVEFRLAVADFEAKGFEAALVLTNPDPTQKGWSVAPQLTERHHLTLVPTHPFSVGPGSNLVITLDHQSKPEHATLAAFRVSQTSDSRAAEILQIPAPVLSALGRSTDLRTPTDTATVTSHHLLVATRLQPQREKLAELRKKLAELKPHTTVQVLRELASKDRRKTLIQLRGNYLNLGQEVHEGLPSSLGLASTTQQPDRLELARWLMDKRNPLTARVVANRLWESVFGIGLVRTSEEFGSQGEPPSHPELLDWLAMELVDSGWNLKHLLRLMVTSAEAEITRSEVEAVLGNQPAMEPLKGGGEGEKLSASVAKHLKRYFDLHGGALPPAGVYQRILREVELPLIEIALDATAGNQAKCAELLGINRNTLRKKITDLDIRVTRRRKLM